MVVGWLEEHSVCGQEMGLPLSLLTICGMQSYEWVGGAVEWVGGACAVGGGSCGLVGWGLWSGWVGPVEWVGEACAVGSWSCGVCGWDSCL